MHTHRGVFLRDGLGGWMHPGNGMEVGCSK